MEAESQDKYRKDPKLELELSRLNELLEPLELREFAHLKHPKQCTVFVVGTPRSGHTLLAQVLITSFRFAYPSNFVARFWKVPGLAMRLQRLVLGEAQKGPDRHFCDYQSDHGLTTGISGIHEFSYFWQDIFGFREGHFVEQCKWSQIRGERLKQVIASLEQESGGLPVLFKNGAQLGLQVNFLSRLLPKSVFICSRRDLFYIAQSHVFMRQKRLRDRSAWFGVIPPDFERLKELPWWDQVAGQVCSFQRGFESQLTQIDPGRILWIEYPDLCRNPTRAVSSVAGFLEEHGQLLEGLAQPPESFNCSDQQRLSTADSARLRKALQAQATSQT